MDGLFVTVGRVFAGAPFSLYVPFKVMMLYSVEGAGMGRRGNIMYRMNKGDERIHSTFRASVTYSIKI